MKQAPPPMQKTVLFWAFFLASLWPVIAQDPAPSTAAAETQTESRPLTLMEAVHRSLQHNFAVQIQRLNPQLREFDLQAAYEGYDPVFTASAEQSTRETEGIFNSEFGVRLRSGESWTEDFRMGLGGWLPTGMRYDLTSYLRRSSGEFLRPIDTNRFAILNDPYNYDTFAGIEIRQPLLRNLWIDANRYAIQVARNQIKLSEAELREQVILTLFNVEQAYNNLIFAREAVRVQEKALELSERLLFENQKRVEVGSMAPLDEQEARAQVATFRAQLIEAQRALDAQENALKNLITDQYSELHRIRIVPTGDLHAVPQTYDVQESWRMGLSLRPDFEQARLNLEQRNIRTRFTYNQLFPSLDLRGSYGVNGVDENYGPSLADLRERQNPAYSVGAILSVPVGNVAARSRHRASKAEKQQALLQLKSMEQLIMVQIDDAIKQARSSYERVGATKEARAFEESALDAEQKKLESGKSTSFLVLERQRRLTTARFEEIRALAEYNNALAQLAYREGTTLQRHQLEMNVK